MTGEDDEEPAESGGGGEDQSQDQGFAGGFVPAAQPPAPAAEPPKGGDYPTGELSDSLASYKFHYKAFF